MAAVTPPHAPEYVRLEKTLVLRPVWGDGIGPPITEEELASGIEVELAPFADALGVAGATPPAGRRVRRANLRVEIGVEALPPAPRNDGRIGVAVALRLDWIGDDEQAPLESKVLSQTPLTRAEAPRLPALVRAALSRTVADAVRGLGTRERVRGGDDATVLRALDDHDPELVRLALAQAGERGLTAAFDQIVRLLQARDEDLRDAAIGALVALGDPRGVKPLTELAQFKDLELMRRVIEAIGAIGGTDARDYLDFVASGHEVPVIQALAREALERLDRREARNK